MIKPQKNEPETVVEIDGVSRQFGQVRALDDVSLHVPRGAVYGLVGVNGAGKTTLLKHVLGLLKPQIGQVHVFGLDPVAEPVGVLSRIGYLSEENDLPGWMRVSELLQYTQAFYPTWDESYAEELRQTFELDPNAKIKSLSRGQKARAGLGCAALDNAARSIITRAGYGPKFGHGLGHGIGLLVHEAPSVNAKSTTTLQPGMVLTIEPGIYIPGWGGVRIEDDIVIGRSGNRVLTQSERALIEL